MPFLAALPALALVSGGISAAGAVYEGAQKANADKFNAQVMGNEQKMAINQSNAQEGLVRRQGREALGRQSAAFGGAGVGYGGSSEGALDQSAVNQELDALNTRYKGAVTGYGYGTESGILKDQAGQQTAATALLAGGRALGAVSPYFGTAGGGT